MRKEVVYAFIDSQNVNLGIKSQGWRLDFEKFRVYLKDKYAVKRAFLFIGYIPSNQNLYNSLERYGYIMILKPTIASTAHKTKGNVDAELVLNAMIEFPNYTKAVIVSGDGDFYCLIEYLVSKKKLEKLLVTSRKYSSLLRKFGKYIVNINLIKNKLQKKGEAFPRDETL